MRHQSSGPTSIPVSKRLATLGRATANAMAQKALGRHETELGTEFELSRTEADAIIVDWPEAPKKGAEQMMAQYGPPNEGTPTKLFWYRKGPWKRIVVSRDVITHDFPAPHSDYLTQWIDYQVPVERFDDLGKYDGSFLVDRTAGEAGARCDSEAANIITLNLMHEIVIGKKSVAEARKVYAENMVAYTIGRPAPYAERLLFQPRLGNTHDADSANMGPALLHQVAGKLGDWLAGPRARTGNSRPGSADRTKWIVLGGAVAAGLALWYSSSASKSPNGDDLH